MMKTLILSILFCTLGYVGMAQEIMGDWYGSLEFPGAKLRLVFHISQQDGQYKATLDSPDQGARDIVASSVSYHAPILEIGFASISANYKGVFEDGQLKGTFTQMNQPVLLSLTREEIKRERPQEPRSPYPYYSEEVAFQNSGAKITLAGTLTLPEKEGEFPAVVLISGSGPQNRDEELMGHKPFLVLSDYLTRRGIAVLRVDDRGIGKSEGDFTGATTLDFATDVAAAVNYLRSRKEICKSAIGLIGHSEGGMIAPVVAARDQDIAFIVLLAGVGVPGRELLLQQSTDILKAGNASPEYIEKAVAINRKSYKIVMTYPEEQARKALDSLGGAEMSFFTKGQQLTAEQEKQLIQQQMMSMMSPWFKAFVTFEPKQYLSRVKCPVLALNGEKDLQVNARQNLTAIYQILHESGNQVVDTLYLPDLNHLFQKCHTGLPNEYAFIQETFSPHVLKSIADWIRKVVQ